MAIPSVGGMAVSLITLFVVPCLFSAVEEWKWRRERRTRPN
jgi:Cu(I)/Ag(I) efflux system membrane protein CusA/SilA